MNTRKRQPNYQSLLYNEMDFGSQSSVDAACVDNSQESEYIQPGRRSDLRSAQSQPVLQKTKRQKTAPTHILDKKSTQNSPRILRPSKELNPHKLPQPQQRDQSSESAAEIRNSPIVLQPASQRVSQQIERTENLRGTTQPSPVSSGSGPIRHSSPGPESLHLSSDHQRDSPELPEIENQKLQYFAQNTQTSEAAHNSVPFESDSLSLFQFESDPITQIPTPPLRPESHNQQQLKDSEAWTKLTQFARRQFLSSLNNSQLQWPIETTFKGLKPSHSIYREAERRIRELFKTWKFRTLHLAEQQAYEWLDCLSPKQRNRVEWCSDFNQLYQAFDSTYEIRWSADIFIWAQEAVSVDNCSELGRKWLKYSTLQLMTRAYLTKQHAKLRSMPEVIKKEKRDYIAQMHKWDREYLVKTFDSLHTRKEFRKLSVADFPFRAVPGTRIRGHRSQIDMNDEPNGGITANPSTHNLLDVSDSDEASGAAQEIEQENELDSESEEAVEEYI
ncbi:hypothetical protein BO71DRAFT_399541 [Aspergillus ellipticus CBS 707.79]|uniref:Uncharacterized protein n=1 Tax=Aspergillus ellipticus CBS 707.79 TaxID=1448320 RepID=A0A319D8Y9_9EURO|nr:hypothetical protein BO71DRAFT_399541 [Aspergillus ellipticus CBS 707.79]